MRCRSGSDGARVRPAVACRGPAGRGPPAAAARDRTRTTAARAGAHVPAGPDLSDADLWLSFESDDGRLRRRDGVPGRPGWAVRRPGRDRERRDGRAWSRARTAVAPPWPSPRSARPPSGCPRAMVEVLPHPALEPRGATTSSTAPACGWRPTRRRPGPTSCRRAGSAPRAACGSCRSTATTGEPELRRAGRATDLVVVRSSVSISDSAWHRVVCRRDATGVSIEVDDTVGPRGRRDRLGAQRVAGPHRQPRCGRPGRPVPRPDRRRVPADRHRRP